ncbi:MAG: efflux RND transporter permease subunit [Candidatus Omnitrophota bacterium]
MNLPKLSVSRPVTIIMIVAGILIFGTVALSMIPQELFPQIVYPQLTVVSPYANAAPEEIETLITKPIEEAVGTVSGVRRIRSVSKEGLCMVMAEFGWNQNINFASLGIREKLDLIKERLPREAEEPIVLPFNPFDKPILILSVTSSKDRSPVDLRDLTRRMIKDEVEKIDGVAAAAISGGLEREILVEVDQDKLQSRSISLLDITKAVSQSNLNYPAGTIKESFYEYLVRTLGEFEQVSEIEGISIGSADDDPQKEQERQRKEEETGRGEISADKRLIYLKDVATVLDGIKERTSYSRYDGRENISISIQKQALGNTVKIINKVKVKLKELEEDLPDDIGIQIVYDQSVFIKESISGVWNAAWQGGVLVFFVLLYFLGSVSSALIVTFTIPISVVATFVLMFTGGISINMMSLGGLAFGVGSLVDCGVVVVENIFRHIQMGKERKAASVVGADEVFVAVTGSILTTVVVFLPLIFVVGIIGQITKDFALTVTFSLLASLVASVTIVPLLASRFIAARAGPLIDEDFEGVDKENEPVLLRIIRKFYAGLLQQFVRRRALYFFLTIVLFFASLSLFLFMDMELMPKVDQGQFFVKIDLPSGARVQVTNDIAAVIEKYIMSIPEVKNVSTTVGSTKESSTRHVSERLASNQAEIAVNVREKRRVTSPEIVQLIKNKFSGVDLGGARIEYTLQENVLATGAEASAPVAIRIKGNELDVLEKLMREVQKRLSEIPGIYGVKNDLAEPSPETKMFIDKDKAALYGLSVVDIAQTSQTALKGLIPSKFKDKGEEIDIRVRLRKSDRDSFNKLGRIQLHSPAGFEIPLSSVATFGMGKGPSAINRINQERTIMVFANVFKRPMKEVTIDIEAILDKMDIPKDYFIKIAGESEEMKASFTSMQYAITAAILLVYMIMAAIFESLWQPLIIMFTIPLALIGVAIILFITRTSVSAYVLMGVGMLSGIVVNNAIVLIDCINLFVARGKAVKDSVIQAASVRLRPILMTAATTILGLIPMAFLGGKGSELRSPIAITVMGGLTVATFLTLVFIPALYLTITEAFDKLFNRGKA